MSTINLRLIDGLPIPYHCGDKALRFGYPDATCCVCGEEFSTYTITAIIFNILGQEIPSTEESAEIAARVIAEREAKRK